MADEELPELLGLAELAELLGARKDTVVHRLRRGTLPQPDARLRAGPIWRADRVRAWLADKKEVTR